MNYPDWIYKHLLIHANNREVVEHVHRRLFVVEIFIEIKNFGKFVFPLRLILSLSCFFFSLLIFSCIPLFFFFSFLLLITLVIFMFN